MTKTFSGFCPTQGKEYSISVNYIDVSNSTQTKYTKGLMTCDYNIFGDKCAIRCPIWEQLPRETRD